MTPLAYSHRVIGPYQWFSEAQFLQQPIAGELAIAFVRRSEEVAHKIAGGTGVRCGAERKEHKRHIEGWHGLALAVLR